MKLPISIQALVDRGAFGFRRAEVRPPSADLAPNRPEAFQSNKRLQARSPGILVSGHGRSLFGERWLHEVLDRFSQRVLLRQGRYVPPQWIAAAFA